MSIMRGKRILLSTSIRFLTDEENFATVDIFFLKLYQTVVIRIRLLTVCHVYTILFAAAAAAISAITW